MWFRQDPGVCPVCGAEHSACTSDSGPVTQVQLPARDAAAGQLLTPAAEGAPPADSSTAFSTKTYRRPKR